MSEKEENEGFRVVDKRRFSSDGAVSSGASSSEEVSSSAASNKSVAKETSSSDTASAAKDSAGKDTAGYADQEINFPAFLMGIYTQTLIYMGDIPHPETNQHMVNLEAAKQNIDILSIIEEKTKGNLTAEEEHLFKEILTTLRLQFVKKNK